MHRCLWSGCLQDALQCKAQAESTDQYLRLKVFRCMPLAVNSAEHDFGGRNQGMHEAVVRLLGYKDCRHARRVSSAVGVVVSASVYSFGFIGKQDRRAR